MFVYLINNSIKFKFAFIVKKKKNPNQAQM